MEGQKERLSKCPICGQTYSGLGNNSDPLNFSRVCDKCNLNVVIPTRLKILRQRKFYDKMEN